MNNVRVMISLLFILMGSALPSFGANFDLSQAQHHFNYNSPLLQKLRFEVRRRKAVMLPNACDGMASSCKKVDVIGNDLLFFPPFGRLVRAEFGYKGISAMIPGVMPLKALWLLGRKRYAEYMKKRVALVNLKCNVERLKKIVNRYPDDSSTMDERAHLKRNINWFLEDGYDEAHEALMNEVVESLHDH